MGLRLSCCRSGVALLIGLTVASVGVRAPAAWADTVTDDYASPGSADVTIPQYSASVHVIAIGASGTSVNIGGPSAPGTEVDAIFPVAAAQFAAGNTLHVTVGAVGAGGAGASGNEVGAAGGNGGQASFVTDTSFGSAVMVVAGAGGGDGGHGAAAQGANAGGTGGSVPQNPPGGNGVGPGAGSGGAAGQPGSCTGVTPGGSATPAGIATDAGGGGGGGDGYCGGGAGSSGGVGGGGGGGGGGGAGGSYFDPVSGATGSVQFAGYSSSGNGSVEVIFTRVNTAPQIVSARSLAVASAAGSVSFPVAATGFPAPSFSLSGAPSWLSIDPTTGVLSGAIPVRTAGRFTFTITATNGVAPDASQQFTLDVTVPPLTATTPGTIKGNVGIPLSATLSASGGIAPYTWSVASGPPPAGLSLSPAGLITGMPTRTGTSSFIVTAGDSALPAAELVTEPVTITIAPRRLTITTSSLAAGQVTHAYSQTLSTVMGVAPLQWSVASGKLPGGLSLNPSSGTISGVPTAAGASTFTVKVTDSTTPTTMKATAKLSVTIYPHNPAVYVTNGANSALSLFALTATGNAPPLSAITGAATGLDGTTAVAIDISGRVYVASAGTNEIAEFASVTTGNVAPSSVIIGNATGVAYPDALAIDSTGRLYVANHSTNSVTVYAAGASDNATPVATIAGPDTGLSGPAAVTIDSAGNLWVANNANSSLTEYPAGGNGDQKPLATISGTATGLSLPTGIDVDANGNIYVANQLGGVSEFSPSASGDAAPLATITSPTTGLASPLALAVAR
jgi:sugar lactone lactonase YvrE